jgi:head-tail adaptor
MVGKIDIGTFDRLVTIQSKAESQDSFGTPTVTLSTFCLMYVAILPLTNQELYATERQTAFASFKVQGHYKAGITQNMILLTNDTHESFDIKSILPVGRKQFIEMVVEKIIT